MTLMRSESEQESPGRGRAGGRGLPGTQDSMWGACFGGGKWRRVTVTGAGSAEGGGARLGRIGRRGQGQIWNLREMCVPWEWRGIYGKGGQNSWTSPTGAENILRKGRTQ